MTGRVDDAIVTRFLASPFFYRMPPKSLDRNELHMVLDAVSELDDADAAATLTAVAAAAVARGAEHFPSAVTRVLVAGGGRHNVAMMAELAARLLVRVEPIENAGLNGDMLEAQAFGYLAVRVLHGLATSSPGTTGVSGAVGGGRISRI
jgi:anhydro-N-acetylmuramic acid kinase